jgi:hypothetical protein
MSDHLNLAVEPSNHARRGGISWRLGVYGGAIIGGLLWGAIAAATVGAPGNDAHLHDIGGPRLLIAAGVSLTLVVIGIALLWASRHRLLRGLGVALMIGPLSGWLVLGSLILQRGLHTW